MTIPGLPRLRAPLSAARHAAITCARFVRERASTTAHALVATWYATALRGVAALALALLCVAPLPKTPAFRAEVFGTYALADGALCGLIAIMVRDQPVMGRRGGRLPLLAGAVGIGVGIYLLATPGEPLMTLALAMAAWGLAVGIVALDGGYALCRFAPGLGRIIALVSGVRVRRGAAVERAMLLAGAAAVLFASINLAFAAAGTPVSLAFVGLFAAAFGYLHLRAGLTLGVLALGTTELTNQTAV
jgi:uncharacterized membrane protein HdeD (DUF308 family)